jgi:hypothetical protein
MWPQPYAAVSWILQHAKPIHYISNPRVHYQHLATRVRGHQFELRKWRAWGCWWIVRQRMPHLPADEKQNIQEPLLDETAENLARVGFMKEETLWRKALG